MTTDWRPLALQVATKGLLISSTNFPQRQTAVKVGLMTVTDWHKSIHFFHFLMKGIMPEVVLSPQADPVDSNVNLVEIKLN